MIFSPSESSVADGTGSRRKPSQSSLFSDRYNDRANTSYVPPHVKSGKNSECTPIRSGGVNIPIDSSIGHADMVSTTKSIKSVSQYDGYSVQSVHDRSQGSRPPTSPGPPPLIHDGGSVGSIHYSSHSVRSVKSSLEVFSITNQLSQELN